MTLAAMIASRAYRAAIAPADDEEEPVPPTCASDQTLSLVRGTSATWRLTVFDAEDERVDLTGHTITFRVKRELGDPDPPEIAKAVGSGITLAAQTGDTLGQADIDLDPADTAALVVGLHVYEVRVTTPGGAVYSVIEPADFVIDQEV